MRLRAQRPPPLAVRHKARRTLPVDVADVFTDSLPGDHKGRPYPEKMNAWTRLPGRACLDASARQRRGIGRLAATGQQRR